MKKQGLLIVFILLQLGTAFGQEQSTQHLFLQEVLTAFGKAIEEKDSVGFQKLFFQEQVPLVGIMSKETEMSFKKNYPEFEGIAVSNSQQFIREICASAKPQKERFYNVKISTDGVIATVEFDYSFHSGEKMSQWGNERWNLVKVGEEWLITDVVYSIRFPNIEAFPYGAEKESKE